MAENLYTLGVGKSLTTQNGFFETEELIYAGMLNAEIFSIVKRIHGHDSSCAYNLYFSIANRETPVEIPCEKGRAIVEKVTPDEILLKYIK